VGSYRCEPPLLLPARERECLNPRATPEGSRRATDRWRLISPTRPSPPRITLVHRPKGESSWRDQLAWNELRPSGPRAQSCLEMPELAYFVAKRTTGPILLRGDR
jgi:hypothetical protein